MCYPVYETGQRNPEQIYAMHDIFRYAVAYQLIVNISNDFVIHTYLLLLRSAYCFDGYGIQGLSCSIGHNSGPAAWS